MLDDAKARFVQEIERLGGPGKVAKQLEVARATVYNWCSSGNVPMDKLLLLQDFGLDAAYVVTGQRSQPVAEVELLPPDVRIMVDNYLNSPPAVQAGVKTTLGAFAPETRVGKKRKAG